MNGAENGACSGYFDEYGGIRSGADTCVFRCQDSSSTISLQSVTFEQIENSCNNVKIASSLGYCSSLTDLIWTTSTLYDDDYGCLCPYCKCTLNSTNYIDDNELITFQDTYSNNGINGEYKICVNSTCDRHPYDSNVDELVHIFTTIDTFYDNQTSTWNEYSCPPIYCKNNYNVNYLAGSLWLEGNFEGVVMNGQWVIA